MLAIRLQRRGRKGHAQFRIIVQESRLTPKSEKVVANLGAYNPHTKETTLDKEKAAFYLSNGAQPSNRVVKIFTNEKMTMPSWVSLDSSGSAQTKNPDKLRKNQPKEEAAVAPEAVEETEVAVETAEAEVVTPEVEEVASEEKPAVEA